MRMITRRVLLLAGIALAGAGLTAHQIQAQIGAAPIRIVFPFGAGGSGDALARIIGEHMREAINRPVIVENRTGAAGRLGVEAVTKSAPDGDTILITPIAPVAIYQHVYEPLYTFDGNFNVAPMLAESMPQISKDGLVYTIPCARASSSTTARR